MATIFSFPPTGLDPHQPLHGLNTKPLLTTAAGTVLQRRRSLSLGHFKFSETSYFYISQVGWAYFDLSIATGWIAFDLWSLSDLLPDRKHVFDLSSRLRRAILPVSEEHPAPDLQHTTDLQHAIDHQHAPDLPPGVRHVTDILSGRSIRILNMIFLEILYIMRRSFFCFCF